ncbi:NAD(P)-binding protein [Trichoderma citrinoviride]|uniref:NAD(P)-binding protein n=1 Tax=Trichoderma citrinoviride TaxID=58853 RepID=A0A2T4BIP4_9HYPO|nr:NAD(P)-binding protein [Trichoderma citrinoviride]PTB69180.1 NAD(P)-binding protein [Trichoderma citrinoviride]
MSRSLLITGATGRQGGAAIRSLLSRNADFRLLAVTRDKTSNAAQKLASLSPKVTLLQGDLNKTDALFDHARDVTGSSPWGVFSVQALRPGAKGPAIEQAQGTSLIDSALKAGVRHFVYSSVDRHGEKSFSNPTDIPHFISKHNIEHHLVNSTRSNNTAMSWTILRPVAFMENLDGGFFGKLFATAIKAKLSQQKKPLQLVATEDIGEVAAEAFLRSEEYNGKAISIAGDEVTFQQLSDIFREKTGSPVPVTWDFMASLVLAASKEMSTMFSFFENEGYGADIAALRRQYPQLKDLRTWLETSPYMKK